VIFAFCAKPITLKELLDFPVTVVVMPPVNRTFALYY
jgi:hypothetical protein